jgi:hypothetical protein
MAEQMQIWNVASDELDHLHQSGFRIHARWFLRGPCLMPCGNDAAPYHLCVWRKEAAEVDRNVAPVRIRTSAVRLRSRIGSVFDSGMLRLRD